MVARMNFVRFCCVLLSAGFFAACSQEKSQATDEGAVDRANAEEAQYPTDAQPKLQTTKLFLGTESEPQEIIAEVALQADELQAGLMFRTNMAENEGMLFVFPVPHRASFWMKNTVLPLSIGYIDSQGILREIHDMKPHDTNSIVASTDQVQYALEMNKGWFDRHKVRPETLVRTEKGSLKESFKSPLAPQ